ncbi:hypothetical protein [Joostella sp.]|uniref:hypothetical protein n=1 Tax=Joostella sp. TaxID=2231138 RepID=UPI003A925692
MIDFSCCEVKSSVTNYINDSSAKVTPIIRTSAKEFLFQNNVVYYAIFTNPKELVLYFNGVSYDVLPNVPYFFTQLISGSFDFMQGYEVKTSLSYSKFVETGVLVLNGTITVNNMFYEQSDIITLKLSIFDNNDNLLQVIEKNEYSSNGEDSFIFDYYDSRALQYEKFINASKASKIKAAIYMNGSLYPYFFENDLFISVNANSFPQGYVLNFDHVFNSAS